MKHHLFQSQPSSKPRRFPHLRRGLGGVLGAPDDEADDGDEGDEDVDGPEPGLLLRLLHQTAHKAAGGGLTGLLGLEEEKQRTRIALEPSINIARYWFALPGRS